MARRTSQAPEDLAKEFSHLLPKPLPVILLALMFAAAVCLASFFRAHAQAVGSAMGEETGLLVGRAIGSAEGLTKGQIDGYTAGKQEGLSAKDTAAELSGKIREAAKLEVLVASGTFSDILSIGKESDPGYVALLSMKYNAVFTVDLSTAEIELREDGLHVILGQPLVEFFPIGDIEKRNEYQKPGFLFQTGSARDGYNAFNNSASQIRLKAAEELQKNESLMKTARSSAQLQLTQLVNAVSLSKPKVFVEFREGA